MKYNIALILPIYNEQENIEKFIETLNTEIKKNKNSNYTFTRVFVDDGSKDESLNVIKKCCKLGDFDYKIISFTKNFGHQNAIIAGFEALEADYYITMDTDLQHDPIHINSMLKNISDSDYDIIQMTKKYVKYEGFLKRVFSSLFYSIFSFFTKVNIKKGSSDFYLIDKRVRNKIIESKFSNNFIRGFIHWSGFNKLYIEYSPKKRMHGETSYNFLSQLDFALTGIYYYSSKIYLYSFLFALILLFFSFLYILFILYKYFTGAIPDGWTEMAILIIFFGSVTLLTNSLLIFMITKIFTSITNKPNFIIKDEVEEERSDKSS